MCYFVYCVCYDVRLSHLNKDYLLTYLLFQRSLQVSLGHKQEPLGNAGAGVPKH